MIQISLRQSKLETEIKQSIFHQRSISLRKSISRRLVKAFYGIVLQSHLNKVEQVGSMQRSLHAYTAFNLCYDTSDATVSTNCMQLKSSSLAKMLRPWIFKKKLKKRASTGGDSSLYFQHFLTLSYKGFVFFEPLTRSYLGTKEPATFKQRHSVSNVIHISHRAAATSSSSTHSEATGINKLLRIIIIITVIL